MYVYKSTVLLFNLMGKFIMEHAYLDNWYRIFGDFFLNLCRQCILKIQNGKNKLWKLYGQNSTIFSYV